MKGESRCTRQHSSAVKHGTPFALSSKLPLRALETEVGEHCVGPLRKDLLGSLDWPWLISFLKSQNFGSVVQVGLNCGTRDSLHPCKYEQVDRIFVQVRGRTRFLLLDPSLALDGLYPYPVHHPYDKHSMVDFEAEEEENKRLWPLFRKGLEGKGSECVLEPGEVLFVPQYHFLHRQDLDQETVSLEMTVSQGRRRRLHRLAALGVYLPHHGNYAARTA